MIYDRAFVVKRILVHPVVGTRSMDVSNIWFERTAHVENVLHVCILIIIFLVIFSSHVNSVLDPQSPSHFHQVGCEFNQPTALFHVFLNPEQIPASAILSIPEREKTLLTVSKPPFLKHPLNTPFPSMHLIRRPLIRIPPDRLIKLLPLLLQPAPKPPPQQLPLPLPLLIDLHTPNHPIRIPKRLRILPHVFLTTRCLRLANRTGIPRPPSPIPAEGDIEYDIQILEILINLATPREFRNRHTPFRRIRFAHPYILRHLRTREMVNADIVARPRRRPNPTTTFIHPLTKSLQIPPLVIHGQMPNPTPHILALTLCIDIAIRRLQFAAKPRFLDRASGRGMQRHFIVAVVVGAFEDVDFAADGPFSRIGEEPEGGPGAADATRAVLEVEDEEAVVVGFFGRDPDAGAAGGVFCCVVDAHVDGGGGAGFVIDGDEAGFGGGGEIFVLDEAVRGIFLVPEVKFVEPVAGGVAVDEIVGCQCCWDKGGARQEYGECWCLGHRERRFSIFAGRSKYTVGDMYMLTCVMESRERCNDALRLWIELQDGSCRPARRKSGFVSNKAQPYPIRTKTSGTTTAGSYGPFDKGKRKTQPRVRRLPRWTVILESMDDRISVRDGWTLPKHCFLSRTRLRSGMLPE